MTEDEKVGYDFEQAPGDGEGQGSLVCCGPQRVRHNLATEQQQQNTTFIITLLQTQCQAL